MLIICTYTRWQIYTVFTTGTLFLVSKTLHWRNVDIFSAIVTYTALCKQLFHEIKLFYFSIMVFPIQWLSLQIETTRNMNMKTRILFVCLGNICRSPAAEGVMKAIVHREGRDNDFVIDSAGIGDWHVGQLPDWRMRRHGEMRGYHFNSLARQFSADDFDRFDLILAMDDENYDSIESRLRHKSDMQKVRILAEYLTSHRGVTTIPDPYYGGAHAFEYALDLIEDACESLFEQYK